MSDNKIVQLDQLNIKEAKLEGIEFLNDFVCDFETGICGPADEIKKKTDEKEENKNANYDMV